MLKKSYFYINCKKIISLIVIIFILLYSIMGYFGTSNAATTYTQTLKNGISAFPESYQIYLNQLHEMHPNWNFEAYYTGISWDELVKNETDHGHNRIIKSANYLWRCSCGNVESGYACASSSITKYYMDPRNFLNSDVKVFQFLETTYNAKIHTVDSIKTTIKNTFLNSNVTFVKDGKNVTMSYAEIILEAAKQSGMSPYTIATKIIQEVGSGTKQADGTYVNKNNSISGNYSGANGEYKGYYNFFNYGANDEGNAIENGLRYAKQKGWNSQYTSIIEGSKLLASSYTNAGQNTAYFYKWDVVGTSILKTGETQQISSTKCFSHQYMTNIQDPTSQASRLYNTYVKNNIIDEKLNFIIPVYDNMPATNKLPTNLTTADGELYYLTGTAVRLRSEPTTSGSVLATMDTLDEIVAVISRYASTDSTGRKWDKVKISSGAVGYIASEYLSPCNGVKEVVKKAEIKENNVNAIPNLTVKDLANSLNIKEYEITKDGVKKADNEAVGTGYVLKDKSNNKEYQVVVLGDVNGDAKILASDALSVLKSSTGASKLSGLYLQAADVNKDGKVLASDALRTLKCSTGEQNIDI